MSEKSIKRKVTATRVLRENPYDLENVFESLSIASSGDKELIYIDRLIATLRLDPQAEITTINHKILTELELIKTPKI